MSSPQSVDKFIFVSTFFELLKLNENTQLFYILNAK